MNQLTYGLSGLLGLVWATSAFDFASAGWTESADLTSTLPSVLLPLASAAALSIAMLATQPRQTDYAILPKHSLLAIELEPLPLPEEKPIKNVKQEYVDEPQVVELEAETDEFDATVEAFAARLAVPSEQPRRPLPRHLHSHLLTLAKGRSN